jgi:hypothetical protein
LTEINNSRKTNVPATFARMKQLMIPYNDAMNGGQFLLQSKQGMQLSQAK